MYGMLLESVQHFIQLEYGEDTWLAILERIGYRNTVFRTHHIYPDDLMMKLAEAAVLLVANGSTTQDFLRFFGRCFVRYFCHYGYEKFIKVCGRYFCDFLTGIDNIHLQMRYMYPKMVSPSMYISHEDAQGVVLNYRTTRNGFCPYLLGQLHQIAHDFYGIQLAVEELPRKPCNKEECYQFIFRLNFDNGDYMADRMMAQNNLELERIHLSNGDSTKRSSSQKALASLSSHVLMQLFPFSLVFRPDLKIISAGCQLKNLFPDDALVGKMLPNVSRMRRPKLLLTWENLYSLQKVLCELELLPAFRETRSPRGPATAKEETANKEVAKATEVVRRLLLQGQLRYLQDWDAMIFLCNPLINNLEDMEQLGLYLNDLSLHGHGRDMVMAGWQHNSRLEDLYERAEERSQQLQQTYELHDEWKKRGDKLLYSMIPQSVADSLRSGTDPIDTCQAFESITVLFVELANIDELTATNAMEAVSCMNAVFSCFDNIIDRFSVYKVETVGKVYMLVGGAPEVNDTHVKDIALVALGFRDEIEKLGNETKMCMVQVRIGFHTGSAVAGVVGKKMPRYCFFGDTINTAARMQTTSSPGKIHISHASYCRLQNFPEFVCEMRGTVVVKGKGDMKTHWLLKYQAPKA